MASAQVRVYGTLNELVPSARRQRASRIAFEAPTTVRDLLSSVGVPHTEVDVVLVGDEAAGLDTHVHDGDRVAAYPPFHRLDPDAAALVRPPRPHPARFVLDVHLGKLARLLRLVGVYVTYANDLDDDQLVAITVDQDRILLTRDTGLLRRRAVVHGALIRADDPVTQLLEVVDRFGLCDELDPFSRCLHCNERPQPVTKADVLDELEPRTRRYYDEFRRCPGCGRIYWDGSHTDRLHGIVARVRERCP